MSKIPDTVELQRRQIQSLTDQLKAMKEKVTIVPAKVMGRTADEWWNKWGEEVRTNHSLQRANDSLRLEVADLKRELQAVKKDRDLYMNRNNEPKHLMKGDRIKITDVVEGGWPERRELIGKTVVVDHTEGTIPTGYTAVFFTMEESTWNFKVGVMYDQYIKYELVPGRSIKVTKSSAESLLHNKLCVDLGKSSNGYDQFQLLRNTVRYYNCNQVYHYSDVKVVPLSTISISGWGKLQDNKIECIKEVREITGWGLRESKQFIEGAIGQVNTFAAGLTEKAARSLLDWCDKRGVTLNVS